MEFIPGKDAVNTVEMATKDLEYLINLVDKVTAGSERFSSKEVLLWIKCYQTATEKSFVKEKVNQAANFIVILRNNHSHLDLH